MVNMPFPNFKPHYNTYNRLWRKRNLRQSKSKLIRGEDLQDWILQGCHILLINPNQIYKKFIENFKHNKFFISNGNLAIIFIVEVRCEKGR